MTWRRWLQDKAVFILLGVFIALSAAYSIINPLFEATDELRHYRFVRSLIVNRALPIQGQEPCRSQSHHPPLYYVLGALVTAGVESDHDLCYTPPQNPFYAYRYWEVGVDNKTQYLHGADEAFPWRGDALAAHLLRFLNVLIGAGTVWVTWAIGHAIWPDKPALALGGAAFIAFNPMFLYMAGAINNDVVAAGSGGLVVLACLRLLRDPDGLSRRWGVWLGAALGIALLSKFSLAAAGALIAVTVTWVAWQRRQWRQWWQTAFISLLVTLLIAGWWFVRNQMLYGDPTGFRELTELWGVRDPRQSFALAVMELPNAWSSLWGRFGFGQIPLPGLVYTGLQWLVGLALVGAALGILRQKGRDRAWALLLALDVLLFFLVLFNYMLVSPAGAMGRFFFPGLPALSILIFYGLHSWLILLTRRTVNGVAGKLAFAANGSMFLLSLIALTGYLAPAYARPPTFAAGAALPNPVAIQFDYFARLRGYEVNAATLSPGAPLDVTLYWEVTGQPPGNYLLFVHLLDTTNETLTAQRDTHPGLGNFPTSQWQPGDRFVDQIRLYLPETAYAPSQAVVQIGLYAPVGYRLGITDAVGQSLGDAFPLGTVHIIPASTSYPNPQDQNFNNQARLIGYDLSQRQAPSGGDVTVTLYWQALPGVGPDNGVELRLLDEIGAPRLAIKASPDPLTAVWQPGQVYPMIITLPLVPESVPPGVYQPDLALLDSRGARQNILAPDGHWIDDHLLLSRIRVTLP